MQLERTQLVDNPSAEVGLPEDVPPRTWLYPLAPMGVGTPYIEALSSYINRLSEAHCTVPQKLMRLLLAKAPGEKYHNVYPRAVLRQRTRIVTGLVEALELGTGRSNLHALTLVKWRHIFGETRLLRRTRAWCPHCYQDWVGSGKAFYEPLMWSLRAICICPVHEVLLQDVCPYEDCRRTVPHYTNHMEPSRCPHCRRSLCGSIQLQRAEPADLAWQRWCCSAVGELLQFQGESSVPFSRVGLHAAILWCRVHLGGGTTSGLARALNINQRSVWLWLNTEIGIGLERIFHLSYVLGVSPLTVLTFQPNQPNPFQPRLFGLEHPVLRQRKPWRTSLGKNRIRAVMKGLLRRQRAKPHSIEDVVRLVGVEINMIRRLAPKEMARLEARFIPERAGS